MYLVMNHSLSFSHPFLPAGWVISQSCYITYTQTEASRQLSEGRVHSTEITALSQCWHREGNKLTCTHSHRQAIQILILLTLAGMERKCKGPGVQQCEAAVLTTATPCHTTIRSIINKNNQFWDLTCHIAINCIWQRQQQSLQEQLTVSMEERNVVRELATISAHELTHGRHSFHGLGEPVTLCGCRHSPLQNSCC